VVPQFPEITCPEISRLAVPLDERDCSASIPSLLGSDSEQKLFGKTGYGRKRLPSPPVLLKCSCSASELGKPRIISRLKTCRDDDETVRFRIESFRKDGVL